VPGPDLSLTEMKSVKLHPDTVDLLRAYCRRTGKTYDGVIDGLIHRQQQEGEELLAAADRLRRIEEMLLRLIDAPAIESAKPKFTIK
jgi:predicted DNA-binding protein